MSSLLNLTVKDRKKLFLKTLKNKALKEEKELRTYTLGSCDGPFFQGVQLDSLIFAANNPYELWLLVYRYMLKHSNTGEVKNVIRFKDLDDELFTSKTIFLDIDDCKKDTFDMLNSDDLYDGISSLMESDTDDDVTIEEVVDEFIEDFFMNDYFWAREINNYDYISDEEKDDSEEDSE
jgi:hypothetical protein